MHHGLVKENYLTLTSLLVCVKQVGTTGSQSGGSPFLCSFLTSSC